MVCGGMMDDAQAPPLPPPGGDRARPIRKDKPMTELGRLERVDLTAIWRTEAQHFTPWLIDQLERFHAVFSERVRKLDAADWTPGGEDDGVAG